MKLAISNLAWQNENNDIIYEMLSKLGFDGIELAPTKWISPNPYIDLHKAEIIAQNIESKYGLKIVSLQSVCFGRTENLFNSKSDFDILLNYMKSCVDFAFSVGCPNIVFGCPKNRIIKSTEQFGIALEFFRSLGEYALNYGISISIEPIQTIYGTNFLNTTKETLDFVSMINHPNILINLDSGAILQNFELVSELETYVPYIGHVHLSEIYLAPLQHRKIHREILNLLKNNGYTKSISIEMGECDIKTLKEVSEMIAKLYYEFD